MNEKKKGGNKKSSGNSRKQYYQTYLLAHPRRKAEIVPDYAARSFKAKNKVITAAAPEVYKAQRTWKDELRVLREPIVAMQAHRKAKNEERQVAYLKRLALKAAIEVLPAPSMAMQHWLEHPEIREQGSTFPHTREEYIERGWIKPQCGGKARA